MYININLTSKNVAPLQHKTTGIKCKGNDSLDSHFRVTSSIRLSEVYMVSMLMFCVPIPCMDKYNIFNLPGGWGLIISWIQYYTFFTTQSQIFLKNTYIKLIFIVKSPHITPFTSLTDGGASRQTNRVHGSLCVARKFKLHRFWKLSCALWNLVFPDGSEAVNYDFTTVGIVWKLWNAELNVMDSIFGQK